MIVTAPASSANLGPGFDCLALALDLPFLLSVQEQSTAETSAPGGRAVQGRLPDDEAPRTQVPEGFKSVESTHPAAVAFREAGGDPSLVLGWRSPIPPGRGLGFSGAARVAGAYAAARLDGLDETEARAGAMAVAATLEGHSDNAAASALGGFVVTAGERVVCLDVPEDLAVVVWSPEATTSTDASRRILPPRVALDDAAFSVGRAALWVAAIASGELSALRDACEDRLHQDARLERRPDSAAARDRMLARPEVLAAWLSGSGPSVAALVPADMADAVALGLPGGGRARVLAVDTSGVKES